MYRFKCSAVKCSSIFIIFRAAKKEKKRKESFILHLLHENMGSNISSMHAFSNFKMLCSLRIKPYARPRKIIDRLKCLQFSLICDSTVFLIFYAFSLRLLPNASGYLRKVLRMKSILSLIIRLIHTKLHISVEECQDSATK